MCGHIVHIYEYTFNQNMPELVITIVIITLFVKYNGNEKVKLCVFACRCNELPQCNIIYIRFISQCDRTFMSMYFNK